MRVTLGHGIPGKQGQLGQIGVYSGSACVQRERLCLGDGVHWQPTPEARSGRLPSGTYRRRPDSAAEIAHDQVSSFPAYYQVPSSTFLPLGLHCRQRIVKV